MTCISVLLLVGCGDETGAPNVATTAAAAAVTTEAATSTTSVATTTTTTTPATSTTATTATTSTTTSQPATSTSTSAPATAAAATLPNPDDPPADERAPEPLVELGTIEIPRINVTKSIYEGVTLTTLDRGPGHWPGTAMPGQVGNVVIAGHRVSHDKPFRHLEQLEPGDDVILTTPDGRFVYKVTGTEIVLPDALRIIDQTPDQTATLFACTPPGSTRQRIVIHLAYAPNG